MMLAVALEWMIKSRLKSLDCSGQKGRQDASMVADIIQYWKAGVAGGLRRLSMSRLSCLEAQVPWTRRIFFWEGYAVGISARYALVQDSANPRSTYFAPGYRFMFWTGLGFWNGVSWPFPPVSLAPERWADVPEFDEEYSLVLGGAGFSITASSGALNKERLESFSGVRNLADLDGVYRGAGRALWFLCMHNPSKLSGVLAAHPNHAKTLAEGVGIAITYTQLETPEQIFSDFASLPKQYWPSLLNGSRVALAGLVMEDARVHHHLDEFPPPLNVLLDEARGGLVSLTLGPGWSRRFVETCERYTSRWVGLQAPKDDAL